MPVLKYIADTNVVSDYFHPGNPVKAWFARHRGEVGLTTLTLAEMRRGIELKGDTKARARLERLYRFVIEDYRETIFPFDEAAAAEWGRMMVTAAHPIPYDDSLIGAIARSRQLVIATRNVKHFPGCATTNPWVD